MYKLMYQYIESKVSSQYTFKFTFNILFKLFLFFIMVSKHKKSTKLDLNIASEIEHVLSIQSFHQCFSIVSLKLDSTKY